MSITRIQSQDEILNRVQDGIIREVNPVLALPILQGRLIEDTAIATTGTAVYHGLGRIPKGWIIVDNDTASTVHRSATSTKTFLYLTASAATTVSIWVF